MKNLLTTAKELTDLMKNCATLMEEQENEIKTLKETLLTLTKENNDLRDKVSARGDALEYSINSITAFLSNCKPIDFDIQTLNNARSVLNWVPIEPSLPNTGPRTLSVTYGELAPERLFRYKDKEYEKEEYFAYTVDTKERVRFLPNVLVDAYEAMSDGKAI